MSTNSKAQFAPRQSRSGDTGSVSLATLDDAQPSLLSTTVASESIVPSTDVADAHALLRRCVADCGYSTLDALGESMTPKRDKSLVSRVLNGERPLTLEFLTGLPDDVEGLYESRRAESFGRIVVEPLTGLAAQKAFVAGLIGVMSAPQLPVKAGPPLKVDLVAPKKREAM